MSGIQALAAAAAATRKISTPASVTASSAQQVVSQSVQLVQSSVGQGQVVQPTVVYSSAASNPSVSSAASVATATGSPIRIVQTQGSQAIRVGSPSSALGKTINHQQQPLSYSSQNLLFGTDVYLAQ